MAETFKWGVLGPGAIAHKFADGLKAIERASVHAVGSRSIDRANTFADKYDAPVRYGSYAELASDAEVDAIYVATLNPFHFEDVKMCLDAGTPVLCEKPFTVTSAHAAELIELAKSKGVFLMEAMWTRFLPAVRRVKEWIAAGWIGEVRMVKADFAFRTDFDSKSRLFSADLGGGGLLDAEVPQMAAQ